MTSCVEIDLDLVQNPERLVALERLNLLDSPADPAFDRLTRLAATILKASVALVTLVDTQRQFFKSAVGLAEPLASARETSLDYSVCQYVVNTGAPVIIPDARREPLLLDCLAVSEFNVVAYAGIPLITSDGHVLGSFCVIDVVPRHWTSEEISILADLAAAVTTEIEMRATLQEHQRMLKTLQRSEYALVFHQEFLTTVLDTLVEGVMVCDSRGSLTFLNRTAAIFHGLPEETLTPEDWAVQNELRLANGQPPCSTGPIRRSIRPKRPGATASGLPS